uniref:NADH:ubiquinone reductase (H(+)-translocating) n=1 Tax=Poecillastra laminaris TaxID=1336882 RepID=A0A0U1XFJ5_9METZ|nr:NADH dehydrogenase subunit 2 [Poecillastra laminaris]AIT59115.1 NADH dehydrogenase subunit 2 [Poecillastra laminaris]
MYETLNIVISSEVLLSIAVLSLVLYGIDLSTLKMSTGVIFIVGAIVGADYLNLGQVLWIGYLSNGLLKTSCWTVICKFIIIIGSISILLMSAGEEIIARPTRSAPILVLIVALSSLLLVSSINWFSIYLAIELQTLTLFILVALKRDSAYSTEASLKFFVLGAVSSGLFLFGCVLLYGAIGSTSVQEINSNLTADIGKILVTISLLFKLSAVPFHMWAPDVYEGSPTIITALLTTVPKIGVFSILVQVGPVTNVVLICAVLSIVYGAIGALNQTKVKRLLAYSGIGHMGFILFGVAVGSFESIQAGLIYMIIYVIMSICSFSILLSLNLTKDFIIEVKELSRKNSVIGLALAFTFLSTAGIPPLAGFLSKWLVLLSGVSSGYYVISLIVVVSSVIAGVYYVRVVQIIYFQVESSILIWERIFKKERVMEFSKSMLIGGTLFIILFLMASPNFLLQITHDATISLY